MNYLAHSILSFSEGQLVGNLIADFIKNSDRDLLPEEIRQGVKIHREIDYFTDTHAVIHEAKKIFQPLVRLYSGAFVDVVMDYFLANSFSENALMQHSQHAYSVLWKNEKWLPESYKNMLLKMEKGNWLYNYREDWGMKFSLQNVLNKAKYLEKSLPVFQLFLDNKSELKEYYYAFFPELKSHIKKTFLI